MADDTATLDAATAPARSKSGLSDQQRASLSSAMSGYQSYVSRLQADRDDVDAKTPTPPKLTAPPPQEVATDPAAAFGQPAMFLALFGSLLTRNHLTNAIGAMGAAMQSTHSQDQAIAKQNYDRWKLESENAIKMAQYQQKVYDSAIHKMATDANAGRAEIQSHMAAMKDEVATRVLQTEGIPGLKKLFYARGKQTQAMEGGVKQVSGHIDNQMKIATGLQSDDPTKQADAIDLYADSLTGEANTKKGTAAERMQMLTVGVRMKTIAADLRSGDPARIAQAQTQAGGMAEIGPGILKPPAAPKAPSASGAVEHDAEAIANAKIADMEKERGGPLSDAEKAQVRVDARASIKTESTNPGSVQAERKTRFDEAKAQMQADGTYKSEADVWGKVNQDMFLSKSAKLPPATARMLADRVIAGDYAAASSFGRSPQMLGQLDTALNERMAEHDPPLTGTDLARIKAEYAAYAQGVKAFEPGGKLEPPVRSLGVATDHLSTLLDAAHALAQSDNQTLNTIINANKTWMGAPGPNKFDAIKGIVAAEIEKAVSGSAGAVSDREDLKANLKTASSPAQLLAVIQGYQELMGGQIGGLRRSFDRVQGLMDLPHRDFDTLFLDAKTRATMNHGASAAPRPAGLSDEQITQKAKAAVQADPSRRAGIVDQLHAWGVDAGGL